MKTYNYDGYHKIQFIPKWNWLKLLKPKFTIVFYSGHRLLSLEEATNEMISQYVMGSVTVVKCPLGWTIEAKQLGEE